MFDCLLVYLFILFVCLFCLFVVSRRPRVVACHVRPPRPKRGAGTPPCHHGGQQRWGRCHCHCVTFLLVTLTQTTAIGAVCGRDMSRAYISVRW